MDFTQLAADVLQFVQGADALVPVVNFLYLINHSCNLMSSVLQKMVEHCLHHAQDFFMTGKIDL